MSGCYLHKKKEQPQQEDFTPMGLTSLTTTPQSCVDSYTFVQVKEASPDITHGLLWTIHIEGHCFTMWY